MQRSNPRRRKTLSRNDSVIRAALLVDARRLSTGKQKGDNNREVRQQVLMPVASMAGVVMPHSLNQSTGSSRFWVNAPNKSTLDWPGLTAWAGTHTKFCADPTSTLAACRLIYS